MSTTSPPTGVDLEPSLCQALKHPLRARILEVVNENPMSPSQFVRKGLVPKELQRGNYQKTLSLVSYHFRQLAVEGCLTIAETNQRRGASEHVYEGSGRGNLSEDEREALSQETRRALSRASVQGVVARTDGALRSGTFDKRPDRHLTWQAMRLDEDGWRELTAVLAEACEKADDVCARAGERLREKGEDGFPATVAMLGFESPPLGSRF